MADKDADDKLSLKLPSLFGGRRRAAEPAEEQSAPAVEETPAAAAAPPVEAAPVAEDLDGEEYEYVEVDVEDLDDDEEYEYIEVDESEISDDDEYEYVYEYVYDDAPGEAAEDVAAEDVAAEDVAAETAPVVSAPAAAAPVVSEPERRPEPRPEEQTAVQPAAVHEDSGSDARPDVAASEEPAPAKEPFRLPALAAAVAAPVVGAVVGLLGCALTFLAMKGCEVVTGTDSCGGGIGVVVLALIVTAMALSGAAILQAFRVLHAGGISVLGVGTLVVVLLLGLSNRLFDPVMIVVVPVVAALSFSLSHWISSLSFDDDELEGISEKEFHDVR